MLEPQYRSSLYDILRPPSGFELDCLLVTTYSASLDTVLTLPAAMLVDRIDGTGKPGAFTPADLAALKRVCSRTAIFCQGGAIHAAERVPPAIIEAEQMVHEVKAPGGGNFHPKTWIMRFRRLGSGASLLRVAILSRNLTGDRSWDAGIVLESGAALAKAERNDLGDLVRLLPRCCEKPLPRDRLALVEQLADEVERVKWRVPNGLRKPSFHLVGGQPGQGWRQPESDRLAILSPFLTPRAVKLLAKSTGAMPFIVSRRDTLEQCWPALEARIERKMVLAAHNDADGPRPTQIHAKILLWERRGRTRLAIGSMNATTAALSGRNVEFMLSADCTALVGDAGVGAILDSEHLGSVVEDFAPEPGAVTAEPPFDDRPARAYLLAAQLHLDCIDTGQGWELRLIPCGPLGEVETLLPNLRFRPVTLAAKRAGRCGEALARGAPAALPGTVPLAELTGFTAFEADGRDGPIAFVLNLEVRGVADEERRRAALKTLLPDERSFSDFLRILLGDYSGLENSTTVGAAGGAAADWHMAGEAGLLELLVRCAADEPDRLASIEQTLKAFDPEEFELVTTSDFRQLWAAVLESAGAR